SGTPRSQSGWKTSWAKKDDKEDQCVSRVEDSSNTNQWGKKEAGSSPPSSGSTMFKDFQRKLQQDTKKTVDAHVHASSMRHSSELKMKKFEGLVSTEVDDVSDITSYISFSFLDIAWLKFNTKLPVLIKSVLTREDAVKAMEVGVERIIVSNHGARQLALEEVTVDI
ncbi:peroxisomal (S)-2-hydroxy-acid oxidase GLO4-like protein isoform X2, partial [Tanacetum coccineum]